MAQMVLDDDRADGGMAQMKAGSEVDPSSSHRCHLHICAIVFFLRVELTHLSPIRVSDCYDSELIPLLRVT